MKVEKKKEQQQCIDLEKFRQKLLKYEEKIVKKKSKYYSFNFGSEDKNTNCLEEDLKKQEIKCLKSEERSVPFFRQNIDLGTPNQGQTVNIFKDKLKNKYKSEFVTKVFE
jgi:hypothetical protein